MIFETDFMKLYEELGALNDESSIPYRINKKFSAEQLDNYIQQYYGSEEPATGSIYIAPNGKFINSGADHANLVYSLETNNLLKKAKNYKSFADEDGDVFVDGEVLAVLLGYVRCNTCIGGWAYISLPARTITSAQGRSIVEWLDKHIYTNRALRSIDVSTDDESHTYQLTDYTSDEIVQKIKRYYASGRLYESQAQIGYLPVSDVELFKEYANDILDGYGNMSDAAIKSGIKEIHFEGKLAGYIGFSEYEEDGHKCLGIGNFMIIERGKGLGSAVIQDIVEKYKNQYDLIYCFVDAKNDGAIRLYKKLGKVYDEDGSNDNGEYYVTFWDNGKWELNEEFDPPYNEQQVRNNYGEETYQRLIKDPAHLWRMKTGIELIHKEPSKMELERIWANWQLMSEKQKLISDKKSIQLFGKTNAENYSELIKLYDDELDEGKKNNSCKSTAVQQTNTEDKRRLEAVQKYCVPISSIIDTIPDKVGAYEVVASNNFIEDFSKYCKKHKDVVEKAKEKLTMALANMTNGIPKAQTDILSVSGPKKFWELKVGRFRDKQELRAIYFTEDITGLNRKFFILGSFFIHADKKFTGDEKKSAVGTYQNIINY